MKKTTSSQLKFFQFVGFLLLSSSSPVISQPNISCTTNLFFNDQILFDTTSLICNHVWSSQNYTLRYKQAATNLWSFVLQAPNKNAYVAIGFSPNGDMIGSSAMVGWVANSGVAIIKQYDLTGKSPELVVPDEGNLNLVANTSSIIVDGSDIYMAFQVRTVQPLNRLIYSVGRTGVLPSITTFRLTEHADMIKTFIDYTTGIQTQTKINEYGNLRRSHGILNMLGWGILLPIGVIVARFFKKWDPLWFYCHVFIQSLGFILGVTGVICGFILKNKLSVFVNRHKGIGITVLVLGCLQVMAFIARPEKGSKYRKYWNWYHYVVGRFVIILAAINVFYGIQLGKAGNEWRAAYAIILVAMFFATILLEIRMWMKK
ncbi:cytochrome b561 and DOMON domain-containing protein At3g07570 [Impatiens glandulifera]|uniref:cytochrome b561 and DOMON domain-containing protein At3g07570 n=1 Tax=Impatiens glandulifera TaxID=253017 RepID=UPI001FB172AF|nr:cytochrome b561 and DOMON domain-containing protein At3g07570 [Impatiens glandulifera]